MAERRICSIHECNKPAIGRGWCSMHYGRFHRFGSPHAKPPGVKVRPIKIVGELAYIPLTQGQVAIIDAADVPLVEGKNWSYVKTPRGMGYAKTSRDRKHYQSLHDLLLNPPSGFVPDHKDGDGLNNRRSNLRLATPSQNAANKRGRLGGSSRFKGVCFAKDSGRWQASIRTDGRERYLGQFDSEEAAHQAYCEAAREAFGEFARFD